MNVQEYEQKGEHKGYEEAKQRQTDTRMGRAGKKKRKRKDGKEIRRERNAQNVSVTRGTNANVKNSLHISSWSI